MADPREELYSKLFDEVDATIKATAAKNSYTEIFNELTKTTREFQEALQAGEEELTEFYTKSNNLAIEYNSLASKMQKTGETLQRFTTATPAGKMLYLGQALTDTGKSLTDLRDKIYGLQAKLGTTFATAVDTSAAALTNTITSIFSKGPALSFQDTIDAVNAYQKEFGTLLTRGAAQDIAKSAKQFGTDVNTFAKAQRAFLVGPNGLANQARIQNTFVKSFRDAGLTANQALTFAANSANLVAIAGEKYADALSRAAANATKIGVGLDKTENFADTLVGDFEGALERFSELRAMGVEVDFNELARVAGTGTPEEVVSELSKQLGGNNALLNQLQRNRFLKVALERDLGLNVADIRKLAAGPGGLPGEETKAEKVENGPLATFMKMSGPLLTGIGALAGVVGFNTMATNANTLALMKSAGISGIKDLLGTPAGLGMLGKMGLYGAAAGVGIGGGYMAYQAGKNSQSGLGAGLKGAGIGTIAGALAAILLAAPTGGLSLAALPGILGMGAAVGAVGGTGLGLAGYYGGRARGGLIRGPGTATSDSILTPLSDGEFVINAAATKMLGTDILTALNSGAKFGFGRAGGGPVGDMMHIGEHATVEGLAHYGHHGFSKFGINYAGASTAATKGLFRAMPIIGGVVSGGITAAEDYQKTGDMGSAAAIGTASGLAGILGGGAVMGLAATLAASGVGLPAAAVLLLAAGASYGSSKFVENAMKGAQERSSDFRNRNLAATRNEAENPGKALAKQMEAQKAVRPVIQVAGEQNTTQTNEMYRLQSSIDAKMQRLESNIRGMKVEMDGNTVGRVSLNARSPLDRLSVIG